jgi:hypothetical protein
VTIRRMYQIGAGLHFVSAASLAAIAVSCAIDGIDLLGGLYAFAAACFVVGGVLNVKLARSCAP